MRQSSASKRPVRDVEEVPAELPAELPAKVLCLDGAAAEALREIPPDALRQRRAGHRARPREGRPKERAFVDDSEDERLIAEGLKLPAESGETRSVAELVASRDFGSGADRCKLSGAAEQRPVLSNW